MSSFLANKIYLVKEKQLLSRSIVSLSSGKWSIKPFVREEENTVWVPGLLVLLVDEEVEFERKADNSLEETNSSHINTFVCSKKLLPGLYQLYPINLTSLKPDGETRHRQLL